MHRLILSAILTLLLASCAHHGIRPDPSLPTPQATTPATPPRWLAIHAPGLRDALQPLAAHRRRQGYEVILVSTSSATSPIATTQLEVLKNTPRVGDVAVLVGSPSAGYGTALTSPRGTRDRMIGHPSDSLLALDPATSLPRITLGRIPATSPAELRTITRKILRHDSATPTPRAFCIIANPMAGENSSRLADAFITSESKSMLRPVHRAWQIEGAADVAGHPFTLRGSDFQQAITQAFDTPYPMIAFFGHSNVQGIASLGQWHLTPAYWQQRAPAATQGLFFTCGCSALTSPDAYGMRAIRSATGPAAVIGATRITYAAIGSLAGRGLVESMKTSTGPATIGDWWRNIQHAIATAPLSRTTFLLYDTVDGSSGKTTLLEQRHEHLQMWTLLGDPAMRMSPKSIPPTIRP